MGVQETAEALQAYGGWGLSSVLLAVVFILTRYIRSQHEARLADRQKVNEKLLSFMESRVETDLRTEHALKSISETLKTMSSPQARTMEDILRVVEELARRKS